MGEVHPEQPENDQGDDHLDQADNRLVNHMGYHIRGYVKSRPVLSLNDAPLLADYLDGVEHAVPDTYADNRE